MVIVMLKFILSATVFATLALSGGMTAEAGSNVVRYVLSGDNIVAVSPHQSSSPRSSRMPGGLLQVRDVRGSSGRSGNGCWTACFSDFDECMGVRTKNLCVSRVKTCLETCDRLSNRPGM
jgi:hypothetical protein